MSPTRVVSRRAVRNIAGVVIGLAVLVAMALDTRFLTAAETADLNPPSFSAETYADEKFPEVVKGIEDEAVDLTVLAPAVDADPAAAGKEYGTDVGSGAFAYPVTATGVATQVDVNFIVLDVSGMPDTDTVRIPLGAALSGTPVRDALGTITFGDFEGQTDFQSVANQFKLKMQSEVLAAIDPATLTGKQVTVVGAWSTGGPPNSFLIQPVSIEVAS